MENQQARQRQEAMRRKTSETIERALTDAEFRQKFLDSARPVLSGPEGHNSPQLPPEAQAQRRALLEQVLDRAASDQEFRQQIADNPRKAIWDAGFGPRIEQLRAEMPQEEVRGYGTGWQGTIWGGTYSIFLYTGFTGW